MSDPKFGDILRYPKSDDPDTDWLFMYIANRREYISVQVVKTHWQDDIWTPGDVIGAGVHELEVVDE